MTSYPYWEPLYGLLRSHGVFKKVKYFMKWILEGRLLRCKRCLFALQKVPFCMVKGRLLECKRCPFRSLFVTN